MLSLDLELIVGLCDNSLIFDMQFIENNQRKAHGEGQTQKTSWSAFSN